MIVASCNRFEIDPLVNLEKNNLNKKIKLSIIQDWTSFNRSEIVAIHIINASEKNITIPLDEGIKIFYLTGEEWIEINQRYDEFYPQTQQNLSLRPGDLIPYEFTCDFPDTDEDLLVRAYILGWEGNEKNPVGAFIEMKLY
jgi:hypothetical protein